MAGWEAELIVGKTRGWISLTLNQRLVKFAIWHRHRKPNIGFFQVSEGIDNRNGAKDLTCFTISWNSCVQRCYHSQAVTFKGTGSQHCFKPGRPPKRKANELPAMATKGHPSTTYMCTLCRFHHLILQHLASWIYLEPSNTNHHRRRTCKSLKNKHVAMHLFFLSFSFSCQSLFQYSNLSSSLSSPIPFEWWISVGTGGRLLRVDGIPYDLKPTLLESAEYKRVATELREWRDCVC